MGEADFRSGVSEHEEDYTGRLDARDRSINLALDYYCDRLKLGLEFALARDMQITLPPELEAAGL